MRFFSKFYPFTTFAFQIACMLLYCVHVNYKYMIPPCVCVIITGALVSRADNAADAAVSRNTNHLVRRRTRSLVRNPPNKTCAHELKDAMSSPARHHHKTTTTTCREAGGREQRRLCKNIGDLRVSVMHRRTNERTNAVLVRAEHSKMPHMMAHSLSLRAQSCKRHRTGDENLSQP